MAKAKRATTKADELVLQELARRIPDELARRMKASKEETAALAGLGVQQAAIIRQLAGIVAVTQARDEIASLRFLTEFIYARGGSFRRARVIINGDVTEFRFSKEGSP